jgi:hypothetical protein
MLEWAMSWIEIMLSLGLIALVVGVAWWFAAKEQKASKPGPVDLDQQAQDAGRQAASSMTNINMP